MALASAVATLLAALFVCLGTGAVTGPGGAHAGHGGTAAAVGQAEAQVAPTVAGAGSGAAYVCPYDRGDCSLFPSLGPAVLSAPPLDPPLHVEDRLPRVDALTGDGPARRSGVLPRAPDLHVLQVLRT
ncbi:hypothetical protein [Streptomyces sp. NPDC003327]